MIYSRAAKVMLARVPIEVDPPSSVTRGLTRGSILFA